MVMDEIPRRTRRGRGTPFLTDPEQYECGKCDILGTFHAPVVGRLVRCVSWFFTLFHTCQNALLIT
jgi:hypothetical protein